MRSNYARPAVIVLILLSVICVAGIVVMMMRSSGTPPVQQTPAAAQEEWDPDDCDAEDKAKGDWEDCWAEFLIKRGKSPTPRPTVVGGQVLPQGTPRTAAPTRATGPSTAAVPAPPRTPGPVRTTRRKP